MRNLVPILLAVVVFSSGCDLDTSLKEYNPRCQLFLNNEYYLLDDTAAYEMYKTASYETSEVLSEYESEVDIKRSFINDEVTIFVSGKAENYENGRIQKVPFKPSQALIDEIVSEINMINATSEVMPIQVLDSGNSVFYSKTKDESFDYFYLITVMAIASDNEYGVALRNTATYYIEIEGEAFQITLNSAGIRKLEDVILDIYRPDC